MLLHGGKLFFGQATGLFEYLDRNSSLADVVQQPAKCQRLPVSLRKAKVLAECHGDAGDQK